MRGDQKAREGDLPQRATTCKLHESERARSREAWKVEGAQSTSSDPIDAVPGLFMVD